MKAKIALIKGDGIGPEVAAAAASSLEAIGQAFGHSFIFREALAGGAAIDAVGQPLPQETLNICRDSEAVLLGAVGGPKWDHLPGPHRPEQAILGLRQTLGLYANLRPARLYPSLAPRSPLRPDLAARGVDLVIVRELTGGIYYGDSGRRSTAEGAEAYDTERYSAPEIERIGRRAFELAMTRGKSLVSVDKANVLESSRLWREIMHSLAESYPEVACQDLYVDNAAMQLIRDPAQFDVIVTGNLFGDILSDLAAGLVGGLGMAPGANIGEDAAIFEAVHGSAPDIAGKGIANPIALMLAAALMLDHVDLHDKANRLRQAISDTLNVDNIRTGDLGGRANTQRFTDAIVSRIKNG